VPKSTIKVLETASNTKTFNLHLVHEKRSFASGEDAASKVRERFQ